MDQTEDSSDTRVRKDSRDFGKIARGAFLSGLSCFMQLYLFQPILPALSRQFSVNPAESSLLVSFPALGLAAGLFTGALLADRISRKKLIGIALIVSSILTMLSSLISFFPLLIAINTLKGFMLSGTSSVIMTYIAEEVHTSVLGRATSLYITGTAVGGMSGRIISTLITGWLSWRWSAAMIGAVCLAFGILFISSMPASRHFKPHSENVVRKIAGMGKHLHSPLLMSMYFLAALVMGSFTSIYNYLAFYMEGAPFFLPHQILASLYLMYIAGSGGSISAGMLSDKYGADKILMGMVIFLVAGLLMMLSQHLVLLITGLGLFTACFFGAHTSASRIVAEYSPRERSVTISLYLLFYYAGSSIMGTTTGVILHSQNWTVFILSLCAAGTVAFLLSLSAGRKTPAEIEMRNIEA